jgi:hypothetical protein
MRPRSDAYGQDRTLTKILLNGTAQENGLPLLPAGH